MLTRDELRRRLVAYREQNWRGVQTPEWQRRIVEDQLASDGGDAVRDILRQFSLGTDIRWLDVGSGIGDTVLAARRLGIEAYGVEPDKIGVGSSDTSLSIARARCNQDGIFVNGVAECLPFEDGVFDVVTLNQVIEHVQDVEKSLRESIRVLKPGGILLVSAPNYMSFYEAHYKVMWLPLFPKPLARLYLLAIGRNPHFLDGINYVTRSRLKSVLSRLPCEFADAEEIHLRNRSVFPDRVQRPHVRFSVKLLKLTGLLDFAIRMKLTFFIRGMNFVVRTSK